MSANIPLVVRLLASSVAVAERAGKIVRDVMSKGELGIVEKGKNDYQTEADRSAQRCIIASLSTQYPKMTIIGEEDNPGCEEDDMEVCTAQDAAVLALRCPETLRDVTEQDVVVWVDPLDGTNEYTQGFLQHVTVLIGIAVHAQPVAGVVHQPYHDGTGAGRSVWGLVGAGVGGLTPAPPVISAGLVLTTTRSHATPLGERALAALHPDRVLRVGGAGYKVLQLLEGAAHVYVFASGGCKKWDTCGPEAVLRSAGGELTDLRGRRYRYGAEEPRPNTGGVLAALDPALHARALANIPQELKDQLDPQ